ncbi:fluoride efflux transporter FluC [Arthrobacter sp. TMN-50]
MTPTPTERKPHLRPTLIVLVFVGGMGGTLSRFWLDEFLPAPQGWPLPTLLINLSGSFLLGLLLEALLRTGPDRGRRRMVRLLGGTGFLGGFTTYSTFAAEAIGLGTEGIYWSAAGYVVTSLVGGILLSFAGIALAATLTRRRSSQGYTAGTVGR